MSALRCTCSSDLYAAGGVCAMPLLRASMHLRGPCRVFLRLDCYLSKPEHALYMSGPGTHAIYAIYDLKKTGFIIKAGFARAAPSRLPAKRRNK